MDIFGQVLINKKNNFVNSKYPKDAASMLIVYLNDTSTDIKQSIEKISKITKKKKIFSRICIN